MANKKNKKIYKKYNTWLKTYENVKTLLALRID